MHGWLRLKGYTNLNPEVEEGICHVLSYMWLESEIMPESTYNMSSKIQVEKENHDPKLSRSHPSFSKSILDDDDSVRGDEVELLMANLGIFCNSGGEKLPELLNCTDLLNIFEEEEPGLDEMKEALDVFDENKDEFIDARELQRILYGLGLKERADVEDCKKMIIDEDRHLGLIK